MADGDPQLTHERVRTRVSGRSGASLEAADAGSVAVASLARTRAGNQAVLGALGAAGGRGREPDAEDVAAERLADLALGTWGGWTMPAAGAVGGPSGGGRPGAARSGVGGDRLDGAALAAGFAPVFGPAIGDVRVRDDPESAAVARSIGARAYALGREIGFAPGAFQPGTPQGRRLIAHELAHVALGHEGLRAMTDFQYDVQEERRERRAAAEREAERRHQAWVGGVERSFSRDLTNQTRDAGDERERTDLALTAQRAAVLDAVAAGQGWLPAALQAQGYAGPTLAEVKDAWAQALIMADTIRLTARGPETASDTRLAALATVPRYYDLALTYARAAEEAHHQRVETENARRQTDYETRLAEWDRNSELDRMSVGPIGEPGERAARGALALVRGSRPTPPSRVTEPTPVSGLILAANTRALAAEGTDDWTAVAADVTSIGNGFARILVATLEPTAEARGGLEYLEGLETRLRTFEEQHAVSIRIPAVFYPLDRTLTRQGEAGQESQLAPEAIPWQFYLTNTGVPTRDQPARSGGKWILTDITSGQAFTNEADASDWDSMKFQQGARVDPPLELFSHLNEKIRFPTGRLYFTLPSQTSYVLETTEPWTLSEFLTAVGVVLAGIAIVASLIATGGASTPAAVAFYATVGAAAAGVGSTLASMHEKSVQGILTSADVDQAMISIGIDVLTAITAGLGRLVALPRAAARLGLTGERFLALQRVTQVFRAGTITADVYQAWSLASGTVAALDALEHQTNLSDSERSRIRGQIIRRALMTGALVAVALKGDVGEFAAGRALRVSHVDADGALVLAPHAAGEARVEEPAVHEGVAHEEAHAGAALAGPHGEVVNPVHASAEHAGSGLTLGARGHEVGVAGSGRSRDIYFCSSRCAPLTDQLEAILGVLPRNHPERAVFEDLARRARRASQRLRRGDLSAEEADALQSELTRDLTRHGQQSELFSALMNTDSTVLRQRRAEVRRLLERDVDVAATHAGTQAERQGGARHAGGGGDPLEEPSTRSPIETDLLGGIDMQVVDRANRRLQRLQFDTGLFSHTYAEALLPGLPRGLDAEVRITFPDGSVGRADRVRWIVDADGDVIGAHVFEVKPNTPDNIVRGEAQVQGYVEALRDQYAAILRAKGKPVSVTGPDGRPSFRGAVVTYDFERMMAVLRAVRGTRRDAARMAELEAVARDVFGGAGAPGAAPPTVTVQAQRAAAADPGAHPSQTMARQSVHNLPPEAMDTIRRIGAGGPLPFAQDGMVFRNREGNLPRQAEGYYREYTVLTPGARDRAARRIVTGAGGEMYWSDDHYRSFTRIVP